MRTFKLFPLLKRFYSIAFSKPLFSAFLLSGATCIAAGCSTAQPPLFLSPTGSIEAEAWASHASASSSGNLVGSGWGLNSGARGQTAPPGPETYIYLGDRERTADGLRPQIQTTSNTIHPARVR